MTSIDRQLAQHIADPTLRHPLDSPSLYKGQNPCEFPPTFLDDPPRPDIEDKNARLLRLFASRMEGFVEYWQQRKGACLELDKLVGVLAQEVAPIVAAARVRAKECEEKSQVCTHHQGAT